MKLEELLKLIEAVKDSDFTEFEFEAEEIKLALRRGTGGAALPAPAGEAQQVQTEPEVPAAVKADDDEGLIEVTAPMVGTFYRAPSPGAEPFVKPGDRVAPGDTLCILEAMKLMNEIQAETEGEVAAVKVENGELVEYGQVLMTLRPLKS